MKIDLDLPRKCLKWLMSGLVKIYGDGFTEMRFGDEFCDVKVAAVRILVNVDELAVLQRCRSLL